MGEPARRARALGPGADARPRAVLGGASPPQADPGQLRPGGCPAPLRHPDEGGRPGRRRGHAARSDGAHDRLRPAVRHLQARQPDLPRPRAAPPAAGGPVAAGADHLRRQGPPGRQSRQGGAPERLPVHPRPRVRGAGGVPRGLRHAPGPPAGAGGGPVDEPAARSARGQRHERDEGGAQRDPAAEHARRMVAGGIRRAQRLGDLAGGRERRHRRRGRRPALPAPRGAGGPALLHTQFGRRSARLGREDAPRPAPGRQPVHRPADGAGLRSGTLCSSDPRRVVRPTTHPRHEVVRMATAHEPARAPEGPYRR